MAKQGRPGIPYEKFVGLWEQLIKEGRATTNEAHDRIGGSKSTIASYREQYEREKSAKEIGFIKSVELTEAVHHAIASVKVKEVTALEKANAELKSRIDQHLATLKETEEKLSLAKIELEDVKDKFDIERLSLERKLAAAQGHIDDLEQREKNLLSRYEKLGEQYSQAKQEAAVAMKEAEMLREQNKKK